ncbi:hypothetical protein L917_05299 [Plasmopara halstedii]|uniref:Calx-beta domain-containing protein n=1 Tax=Plasmopara halstedii TaxID=4781 RepID=A0A0P1B4R9_PLAHL|nr:hypothetical protein L917_05299 [Plasmopara halstedii]CEG49796.1 hypothetical protein L917_05299 [Plasmopara halstedii]|eukprot:XP_024586165.1 hypothetical protein L917_05299 [Plasmopara halstedii]
MSGCRRVRSSIPLQFVVYLLLLIEAPAKRLTVLVQPQTSTAGEPFVVQPVIALTDDSGNILIFENDGTVVVDIRNNLSRFAVLYPQKNDFAIVNGIVRCFGLYINEANIGYTLVFSSYYHGVWVESSSFEIVVGPKYRLAMLNDISKAISGTPFLPQPALGVVDRGGNIVTATNEGYMRIEFDANPVGGVLQPAAILNVSISGGIGRFSGIYIEPAGSPYRLRYTTDLILSGGNTVVTNFFTVAASECNRLVLESSLGEARGGKAFSIQPVLMLLDTGGNLLVADSSSKVSVAIAANPSRGTITPIDRLTVFVRKGMAVFRGLKIDKAGNGYSLRFTLYTKVQGKKLWINTNVSVVSEAFDVLTGDPVSLLLQRNLSNGIVDGQPNHIQPVVELLDAGGNLVSSLNTGSVSVALVSSPSVISSIVVDTSAAPLLTVVNVRALVSSAYPMPYGVGARVAVQVTFSDEVTIRGTPTLELASSVNGIASNGQAVIVATTVPWTTALTFEYVIVATDNSPDLEYTSTTALSLNGGLIVDRNGKPPILTLPALGSINSLGGSSAVIIDTTAPMITSIFCSTPGDGEYGTGQQIELKVKFSHPVSVRGDPYLPVALMTVGGTGGIRLAAFYSGSNTDTLVFVYTVQTGDAAAILDVTASIDLNGGFIKRFSQRPTTDAVVTVAPGPFKLSNFNSIVIETAFPTIDATVGVTSGNSSGIYAPGDEIIIFVAFTKPVTVIGYPRIILATGPTKRYAGYTTGSGSKVLTFAYQVSAGDHAGSGYLNYQDDQAFDLNGGSITRSLIGSSNLSEASALLTLASTTTLGKSLADNAQLSIDGIPPSVSSIFVSSAPSTTVYRGDEVIIAVSFSGLITVDLTRGTPFLQLEVGDYNRKAVYKSGSGSQSLLFSYIVNLGDITLNGVNYRSKSALLLNGATIRRTSKSPTLDANLMLPDPPSLSPQIIVNPSLSFVTRITELSADVATGTYGTKQTIIVSLSFSDEVALLGVTHPVLKLNTGTIVPYVSGSTTQTLVFLYVVKDGETSLGLDKFDDNAVICLAPNCQIINRNSIDADLSLTAINLVPANIAIDTKAPQVLSIYALTLAPGINAGSFVVGDIIEIVIQFDLEVDIEPPPSVFPEKAPVLLLNTVENGKPVLCRGYANNDRHLLLFKYIVELGDVASDLMYIDQNALLLGQSTIKRLATSSVTNAVLTLPLPAPLRGSLSVNGEIVPSVLDVSSSNTNGQYRGGDQIALTVTFSQHVVVKGNPVLWLDTGVVTRTAIYSSGSGTTVLTFIYTVQEGDYSVDLEYVDNHSLDLSDRNPIPSAILHMSTIPTTEADINLPYPRTQGSLSYNKNFYVNGRQPSIISTRFVSNDGIYKVFDTVVIEVTFSSCVIVDQGMQGAQGPTPRLRFRLSQTSSYLTSKASTISRYGVYISGSPGTALRFEYTIQTGDFALDLDYSNTTALELNGARILTCTADANVAASQSVDLHLNPPKGRLLGRTVVPINSGRATFTDLFVNSVGNGYRVSFSVLHGLTLLETSAFFDMLPSAVYMLRSTPFSSGDQLGTSVDVDSDTLVLGGPGASRPAAAVQIVTVLGDAETFVDEIQVLQTTAKQRPAVQILTSTAAPGETIGGFFYLKLGFVGPTRRLPYNADPTQLSIAIQMDLGFEMQTISVTRELNTYCACDNGYVWHITFHDAEGPLDALTAVNSQLTGRSVSIGDGRSGSVAVIAVPSTILGGALTLQLGTLVSRNIMFDVNEAELTTILTQDFNLNVWSVSRSLPNLMKTYTWKITFRASDTMYDVPQLLSHDVMLSGYGARSTVRTERNGQGRLFGSFRLQLRTKLFLSEETDDIPVDASEHEVKNALENLVSVNDVTVHRSAGMNDYGGYSWSITFLKVSSKNKNGPLINAPGNLPVLVPNTTKLKGTNARVDVQVGSHETSLTMADKLSPKSGLPVRSAGMVAIFTRGQNDWEQQDGTITGHDTREGDLFGSSVSLHGLTLLVGAPTAAIYGDFEKQSFLCDADGGYLRIVYRNKASKSVAYNAPMQELQSAIATVMSVDFGEIQIDAYNTSLCAGVEIVIALRGGNHGDSSGDIPDLVVDSSALRKGLGAGNAQMHEYLAGTFRSDGASAKGSQCGAAYMFRRDENLKRWVELAKIAPPADQISTVRDYGSAVALLEPFAVVGAPGSFDDEGRVFVYQVDGIDKWMLFQTLSAAPEQVSSGDRFGEAVAISGILSKTLVIGAPGYALNSGAVFVYDLVDGFFQRRQILMQVTQMLKPGDRFGNAVDLDMSSTYTLAVGAHCHTYRRDDEVDAADSGAVLVFVRRSERDIFFVLQQVLYSSDIRARDRFGTSVAIANETIIVGAHELYEGDRTIRKAVQVISSSVSETELTDIIHGGSFTLSLLRLDTDESSKKVNSTKRANTRAIAHDICASDLQVILKMDLNLISVNVQRDGPSISRGYTWYVTFAGSSGKIPLLEADSTQLIGGEITVKWANRLAPVLRGNAYVFTRDVNGVWIEQATISPRDKQTFAWFGSAVAVHKRTAVFGSPNLDSFISGTPAGGAFVSDLGIFSLHFSAKTYSVLEGDSLDITVERCSRVGFCAVDVSDAPQLYVQYDTGDAFSDRQFAPTHAADSSYINLYQKLARLDAAGKQTSQWLHTDVVGTANGRDQFYGSSERRSLWVNAQFDYAGTSDYSSSSGTLFFDSVDDVAHSFVVRTTDDSVVENPDETLVLRLSLPGIRPSVTGDLWSTVTIIDDGDGGSGARSYLAHLNSKPSLFHATNGFSSSVSIFGAGNAAAIGAPLEKSATGVKCGAVHFFVRRSGFWEHDATVFPSDCARDMKFGSSVAIDGSLGPVRAIVGAPGADAAYIYLYRSDELAVISRWLEETRLDEPTQVTGDINHNYASSKAVAIFGDIAVVGASGLERVFVYHREVNAMWKLVSTLRASDSLQHQMLGRTVEQSYGFGHAVEMDKRTIIVGAPLSDAGEYSAQQNHSADFDNPYFAKGAVYIFYIEAQEQHISLRTSDLLTSGTFRLTATRRGLTGVTRALRYSATAFEVKTALEGREGHDDDGSTIDELGFKLVEVDRTGSVEQGFTWRVTFIGDVVKIPLMTASWLGYGCPTCNALSSTYIADPSHQILISEVISFSSDWKQQVRLTAPDGNAGDHFGVSVGISGEQAIVGAARSSALTTTTWDFETGDLTGWLTTGTAFDQQPTFGDNSYGRTNFYRPSLYIGASPTGQRARHEGRYWVGTFEGRPGAGKANTATHVAAQMCAFANNELCRAPNYKMPSASTPVGSTQGDGPQGTLTSLPFTIEGQWLSFRIGGGCDIRVVYVELLIDGQPAAVSESVAAEKVAVEVTVDGSSNTQTDTVWPISATSKLRATGRCRETMHDVTWDLSLFVNRTAQIRVVDASSNANWGHINFDDVRFSWGATRVAQTSTSKAGAAYTFRRRAPGTRVPSVKCDGMNRWSCEWEFQARLAASDKRSEDLFGSSVAVDDISGVAVVAAPGQRGVDANNTIDSMLSDDIDVSIAGFGVMEQVGSLYVYRRSDEVRDDAGNLLRSPEWLSKEAVKMQYPQKQRQSQFGAALDLDGRDLLVGAPGFSISSTSPQSGRAFAYDLAVVGVKFTDSWFSCIERNADGFVGLKLLRSAATSNLTRPLTVGYATEDRSAVGVDALKFSACTKLPLIMRKDCGDYQQISGEITFAAGETSTLLTVPIMDDTCFEQWEKHFVVRLHVPGGEPLLGEDFIARVRIDDDDFNSEPCGH